jgi:competence protein ComEA
MRALRILFLLCAILPTSCSPERGGGSTAPAAVLDLNAASQKELETLPGIGPVHARSIIASRNARGGRFKRLEDLVDINGIGNETVEKIRPYVVLGPGR